MTDRQLQILVILLSLALLVVGAALWVTISGLW